MATAEPGTTPQYLGDPSYPTSDGRYMPESDLHFTLLGQLVQTLREWLADDPMAYAGGNMLLFYERGNRRKHVSPDVFVTLGVPKEPMRLNYIPWLEGKAPDVIIELTSRTTHRADKGKKLALYRDILKIPEYFLFDPKEKFLNPALQGYRLIDGDYTPIEPVHGRLPCESLGLLLGREGEMLRLYDAATGDRLPTANERAEQADERAELAVERADRAVERAELAVERAELANKRADRERQQRERAEAENRELIRQIEELRRQSRQGGSADSPS